MSRNYQCLSCDLSANGIVIDVDRNTNIPGPLPRSDKIEESHLKFTYGKVTLLRSLPF